MWVRSAGPAAGFVGIRRLSTSFEFRPPILDAHVSPNLTYSQNTPVDEYEVCILHPTSSTAAAGMILSYALYRKQMPVLLVCPQGSETQYQGLCNDLLTGNGTGSVRGAGHGPGIFAVLQGLGCYSLNRSWAS